MAQPDLYLLPREGSFEANFVKGYIGIWLQMLLVIAFGVMWSTFLNGAVAMLATLMTLIAGQFAPWVQELATGQVIGGNTFEAAFVSSRKPASRRRWTRISRLRSCKVWTLSRCGR